MNFRTLWNDHKKYCVNMLTVRLSKIKIWIYLLAHKVSHFPKTTFNFPFPMLNTKTITFLTILVVLLTATQARPYSKPRSTNQPLWGISYTPNTATQWCPTQDVVNKDMALFSAVGITHLRMYSQGCNILQLVFNAIQGTNIQVLAGVYVTSTASDYSTDIAQFITTLKSTASSVVSNNLLGVIIGNEVISSGFMSESQLLSTIQDARGKLSAAGFGSVKVTTTEIPTLYSTNIINAVDFMTPNVHVFWSNVAASDGYTALDYWVQKFKSQSNKDLYIGETGWPTAGNANGPAIPSTANQQNYATQVACKGAQEGLKYFWFEAFDATWKTTDPSNIEQHWGIWTPDRVLKAFSPRFSC